MRYTAIPKTMMVSLLFGYLTTTGVADSPQTVREQLGAMNAWLGSGPNGERWREYLDTELLEEQLAAGNQSDLAVVRQVLSRYQSGASGLEHPRFVAVREALTSWIEASQVRQSFAERAEAAKAAFRAISAEDVARVRSALVAALAPLDAYLAGGGENGEAWKRYLKWTDLEDQASGDEALDIGKLARVHQAFTNNHQGLELPQFTSVTDALRKYIDYAALASAQDPRSQYEQALSGLADRLESYVNTPDVDGNYEIGRGLGALSGTGQAPDFVASVRQQLSRPNLHVSITEGFINDLMADEINNQRPIRDTILDTPISGTGYTTAQVSMRLIPNHERATLETHLQGTTLSRTVGFNRVRIHSNGTTTFTASKRLMLTPWQVNSQPAVASARTSSCVTHIDAHKIVQRIARKQIRKKQPQANAIAARHAERRITREFDEQIASQLQQANRDLNARIERWLAPLKRRRSEPAMVRFSTSAEHLMLTLLQADRFQLGAPDAPPALGAPHEIVARVHESWVNNIAGALLAGRKLTDEKVVELSEELSGELPEGLAEQDEEPWSITFARRLPVSVEFSDGKYTVTIRGREFTSGDREFKAMNISATYQITSGPQGVQLRREGDVSILPPGFNEAEDRLSTGQVTLRTILTRKFAKVFEEEVALDSPIEFKVRRLDKPERLVRLHLGEMLAVGGWLGVGFGQTEVVEERVAARP